MTMRSPMAVTLLLAAGFAAAGEPGQVETAEFTARLPSGAERKDQAVDSPAGPLSIVMWQHEAQDGFVALTYVDYPPAVIRQALPQKVLDGGRDGAIANINGTLTRDVQVFIDSGAPRRSWPGRLIEATTPQGMTMRARIYLVDARLYQLISVFPSGKAAPAAFEALVASFKLKPPREP